MSALLQAAVGLTRTWTAAYTTGLPRDLKQGRRAEIESDLWEHWQDASAEGQPVGVAAGEVLGRCLRGIPADLFWRFNLEGEPKMFSKTFIERGTGLAMLLILGLMVAMMGSGFGIGADEEYFRDDFPRLAQDPDGFGAGLLIGSVLGVVAIGAAGGLYLTFRPFDPVLATIGSFGLVAAGVLLIVDMGFGRAVHDLAKEWSSTNGTPGDPIWTSARTAALSLEFLAFSSILLMIASLVAFGILAVLKAALPRWVGALPVVSGVFLALAMTVGVATGAFWALGVIATLTALLWLLLAGALLVLRGTEQSGSASPA